MGIDYTNISKYIKTNSWLKTLIILNSNIYTGTCNFYNKQHIAHFPEKYNVKKQPINTTI